VITSEQVMPIALSRRERLRAMMRGDILNAAREIVRADGFKELSMRTLARSVGVTAPTLYDYFPSKEAVLDALYVEGVNGMIAEYDAILSEETSGLDAIVRMARAYRTFAITQQDIFLLIFGRVDSTYIPGEEECTECRGLFERVISAMHRAIGQGEMVNCDPEVAAYFLWTTVHGAVMLEVNRIIPKWDADVLRAMFEQNLGMLRLAFQPER
jgi:AcrR family transcriptional regulator